MEIEQDQVVEVRRPVAVPDIVKDSMSRVTPIPVPDEVWDSDFVEDSAEDWDGAEGVA